MGSTPQIVRANMDGSSMQSIISGTNVQAPTALAIDPASECHLSPSER